MMGTPPGAAQAVHPAVPTAVSREAQLAALLLLEQRARACDSEEALGFLIVNDSHGLVPYRQAVLWQVDGPHGDGRIAALSGLAVPDPHAPFNVWLAGVLVRHSRSAAGSAPGPLGEALQGRNGEGLWEEHLPRHSCYLPLPLQTARTAGAAHAAAPAAAPAEPAAQSRSGPQGGLLLLRDEAFTAADLALLGLLADAFAHAWRGLRKHTARRHDTGAFWRRLRQGEHRKRWLAGAVVGGLMLLCLPVRQSVLAPAEVVARAPAMVRAPLQGVVDRILVQPNQQVERGQLLAALDARELESRLETSRQALAIADGELRQGSQQALIDERSKSALGTLQGKREQAASDSDYLQEALSRTQLHAERAGIVIFDDASDWIGKPVALGERIMQVADPTDTELEVQLPVADAIALQAGAPVRLFLNTAPASPVDATLLRVGYRAAPTADGTLAYRVRARLDTPQDGAIAARVGLKGTAKLYGERTALALYLLRRPLATLRVWIGV